jgi:hypothetical protein
LKGGRKWLAMMVHGGQGTYGPAEASLTGFF